MTRRKQVLFNISFLFVVVVLCLPLVNGYQENVNVLGNRNQADQKLSPQVTHQVIIHGFLLWASMGFLTPVGILLIRKNSRLETGRRLKILYYLHIVTQIASALLVTIAAVLSIKNFENLFNNSHQRMGLALYIAVWIQSMTAFFRPKWGTNGRSLWFFIHWVFGTFVMVLGILSIYSGLEAYQRKTFRSATVWTALFTVEIVLIAFGYLLQDKWEYIEKQEVMPKSLPMTRVTNNQFIPHDGCYKHGTQPC